MFDLGSSKSLLSSLRELLARPIHLEETPLKFKNQIVGWHSVVMTDGSDPFAGGTGKTRAKARRIAIAEAFERGLVYSLSQNSRLAQELSLEVVPSCSGFAAGFQPLSTHKRALFEAIERWSWSQWIDHACMLPPASQPSDLSDLDRYMLQPFKDMMFFERKFSHRIEGVETELSFKVFLGLSEDGIFPGSRVSETNDTSWSHTLVEAHRNYFNFGPPCLFPSEKIATNMISRRASFFAKNKSLALKQIIPAQPNDWPEIRVILWKHVQTHIEGVYLSRALCGDHLFWHLGPVERFVY